MDTPLVNHYTDFQGMAELRREAGQQSDRAVKEVARQFESMFLQMMLKTMRDASPGEDLLDGPGSEMFRDMYDKQIAVEMANAGGIGMAEIIARQLQQQVPSGGDTVAEANPPTTIQRFTGSDPYVTASRQVEGAVSWDTPQAFVDAMLPHARRAAEELGIPAQTLVAQAALETGWGQHMLKHADGKPGYSLFGIKADHRWEGERIASPTLEFENGMMVKRQAAFRAYESPAAAFEDYVRFIKDNPRYHQALQHKGDAEQYLRGIQTAGYATDPDYADKILRILASEHMNASA